MNRYITKFLSCILLTTGTVYAQNANENSDRPTSYISYKSNPNAPSELSQFEFMIGEFNRVDSVFNRSTGQWDVSNGEWNAGYILNGLAIQDHSVNYASENVTTNIRIYDSSKNKWVVSWFKMPGPGMSTFEGEKIGNEIILKGTTPAPNSTMPIQLIFFDIKDDSYKWKGQINVNGQWFTFWKLSCVRKS